MTLGAGALSAIFIIIPPFLGIFLYLIARSGKLHERAAMQATQQQMAVDSYVTETAGGGTSSTDELASWLKQQGYHRGRGSSHRRQRSWPEADLASASLVSGKRDMGPWN
jgi:hypothetical protein